MIGAWLRQLAAAASGVEVTGYLVARDAVVTMAPLDQSLAHEQLGVLVSYWRRNLDKPVPVACKTALALVQGGDPRATYNGGFELAGEVADECLARLWPDFAALAADPEWFDCAKAMYGPLAEWIEQHVEVRELEVDES